MSHSRVSTVDSPPRLNRRGTPLSTGLLIATTLSIVILLLGIGGGPASVYLPCYAAILCTLASALATGIVRLGEAPWSTIDLICGFLVCLPLAQIALRTTANPAETEQAFLHISAAIAVFWLIRETIARFSRRTIQAGLAALGGGLALEGIFQHILSPHAIYGLIEKSYAQPMGPFVNRDDFAACIELLLPFSLLLTLKPRREQSPLIWLALSAICMAAIVYSASRTGVAVALLELVVAISLDWRSQRTRSRRSLRSTFMKGRIPILLGAIIAACVVAGYSHLLDRFSTVGIGFDQRLNFYRSGLTMAFHRPLLGFGLGTWVDVYPHFARIDNGQVVNFAHSDYVQWLAETGTVGILAVLALIFAGIAVYRRRKSTCSSATVAGLIGLTGFALHATVDFPFHIPGLLILFAAIAGFCCADPCFSMARSITAENSGRSFAASQTANADQVPPR